MRVPVRKLRRAFPEFDGLSASKCEEFLDSVRRELGLWPMLAGWLGAGVATVACVIAMIVIGRRTWLFGMPDHSVPSAMMAGLMLAMFVGPFAGLLVRDMPVRRAIRRRIDQARCRKCHYSLVGLEAVENESRCPECGQVVGSPESLGVELRAGNVHGGVD